MTDDVSGLTMCKWFGNVGEARTRSTDQFYRDAAAGAVVTDVSGLTMCTWFGNVGEARIRSTDHFTRMVS